ncbi:MAG: choice-of-anchor D domain-containing protein, partial [Candidatus Cloacimonetes bacterium]|nr:choice-of-anchor D domain-containing protein [Candidatus Cloacimonadota bacterium]
LDYGTTWTKLEAVVGTGANFQTTNAFNWYNNESTSGPITQPKWSARSNTIPGQQNGWIATVVDIPSTVFSGADCIILRYHFGTDSSTSYEGWAIDDISIYVKPDVGYTFNFPTPPVYPIYNDDVIHPISNNAIPLKVKVTNMSNDATGIDLTFKLEGVPEDVVSTGTMAFMETKEISGTYTFPSGGLYDLSVEIDPGDVVYGGSATVSRLDYEVFNEGWLVEGFEGSFLPSRWVQWNEPAWEQTTASFYDGAKAARVTLATDSPGSFLTTPRLSISTGDYLTFWAKSTVADMQLQIRHNDNADPYDVWTALGAPINLTTTFTRYDIDLSSLDGQNERFAFEALPNAIAGTIYLDRVLGPEIYVPTAPPGPVVMLSPLDRAVDVNPKTVVLDWDVPLSGGDPEWYTVIIGFSEDPEILVDNYEDYKVVFAPVSAYQPYTASPSFLMDYDTDYYWMVVPENANGIPTPISSIPVYKLTTQPVPLAGNWTIDPEGTGPTNFTTWTACINYLNAYGVDDGGVTITVANGTYTGPFPAITYNATDTNPVTFVAATGSRDLTTLMAGTGTGGTDTIIHLNGADYITFDGFDIIENPANTDATTRMEYGVYVTNNGATDGARNNTIKNCSITLAGTSVTRGVYQLATSVTTAPGSNSYNKYYDNTLLNCWFGYNMVGSSTATAYDVNTEIGGTTAGTITNALQGVAFSYQENIHIYKQSIVLLSGSTPTASPYGIYTNLGGNNSMDAYDNTIYMAANLTASFTVYGISMTAGLNANIYRNVIRDFNVPTTFYGINLTVGSTKQPNYIYDNDIYNITMAGGTYYGINCTATHVNWIYGNELYATTVNGSAYAYPLYIGNSATTNLSHVHTNIIRNITTTGSVYPYHAYLYYGSTNFYNNQIHTCASTSVTYPLYSNLGVTKNIYNNSVYGITQTGTSALYGIYLVSATTQNVYDNRVYNLTGGGTTAGIYANASLTTASTYRIHRNNVSNITYSGTSTSVCYGIYVTGSSTMATVNVYNNMISNLKAPVGTAAATAAQIIGVYYTTAYRFNLWNNSVYLNATSTNANFSTTALQIATQGVGTLADLRNNILVNKSANGTSGRAVAFWKTTANVFTYISAGTDKNIYYAGVPSARNLIYYDTTNNNIQTLAQYKTLLATKDQNAYTEDVPFALTTTDDLHINWTIPTVVEGRAIPITPDVDVDYDVVDARNATTPDIGADEGPFTPLPDVNTPLAQGTNLQTVPGSTFINATFTISDASHYLVVRHTDPTLNTTPVELTRYADGATLGNGIVVSNVSTGVFTASGLSAATQYNFTIFANNQNAVFGPKYLLTDPLTGTRTTLPTAPAAPAVFTASSGGSYQINLIATANGNSDPIMVAWNTVNTFGTPASNVTYSQGSSITGGGTVWYIGAASGLPNHTGLNPSTTYYYRAWSYITSDEYYVFSSSVLDRNATTWAAPVTSYPYNEGFESGFTNGVALGAPYTQVAVSGTGSWTANSTNTTYNRTPRTGSFNATLVYSNSRWLFRPFQLTGGVEYQFKMYARQDMADPSYANMTVAYGNAPTDAAMTNIIVPQTTIINGDYQLLSAAFTPSASGTYMIGIKGTITGTPWYISIDDISLRPTPTAPEPPTGLSPAMAAVNRPISVDLSWNNEGIVTKIDVYFSTDSTAVYTLDSSARVATNQTSPLNSYDLPTLNFSTRYFWQIVCKDNAENQAVSGLYYFNTMADPSLPVPFAENFGTLTALPAGWSMDASSYSGVDATHGRTGSGLYINLYSSIPTFNITMPLIGPLPNYAMLKFDYRIVDYSGYPSTATTLSTGDSVNIMISTNYGATYSRRGSINSTNHVTSTGWATFQVPLVGNGAVVGDRVIIRYSSKWGAGDWYLDIDNVEVTTPPNEQLYGIVPGSYNFGEVQITANSTRQFTVSNSGTVDFDVTSIYVSGGDASLFGVSAAGLPATVGYSTSYNFNVTFTPLTTGPKTTTLYVVDNITGRVEHQYTLTATGIDEFLGTPINLQASVSDYNDVALSWSPVLSSPYVTWSGNSMGNSFRLTGLTSFDAASKFTTTDLAGYRGLKITKVKFFAANEDSAAFRVRIWTGADVNTDPTTMVRDIEVPTYTQNDWNEVTLGTPLTISGTDALWIGYNVVHTATSYPAAIDSGPFVANKGCLYSSGGAWTVSTLGANLMVKAYTRYIEDTREGGSDELMIPVISLASSRIIQAETDPRYAQTRALQGYNVYRNGSQINPTLLTGTTYNDLNVPNGNYDYWVKAVYETGTSNPSNTVTLNINRPAAYTLPFTENWSSGNFTANYWTKVASNWAIGGGTGNPAPAARFNYNPIKYGYNEYLTSWDIDALTYTQVNLKFDVLLDTNTTETLERLAVEVYDGSAWQQIDSFSNTGGDFPWNSKNVDISAHASNRIFQFRFRAYGSDSSTLNYWAIDNIVVEAVTAVEPPVVTISLDVSGYPLLSWDPVAGATSYKVYGCNDPYATFPGLAWEMLSSQPGSTYLHDVDDGFLFFNVTAVVGSREISIPALGPNRQTPVIKTKK